MAEYRVFTCADGDEMVENIALTNDTRPRCDGTGYWVTISDAPASSFLAGTVDPQDAADLWAMVIFIFLLAFGIKRILRLFGH